MSHSILGTGTDRKRPVFEVRENTSGRAAAHSEAGEQAAAVADPDEVDVCTPELALELGYFTWSRGQNPSSAPPGA